MIAPEFPWETSSSASSRTKVLTWLRFRNPLRARSRILEMVPTAMSTPFSRICFVFFLKKIGMIRTWGKSLINDNLDLVLRSGSTTKSLLNNTWKGEVFFEFLNLRSGLFHKFSVRCKNYCQWVLLLAGLVCLGATWQQAKGRERKGKLNKGFGNEKI